MRFLAPKNPSRSSKGADVEQRFLERGWTIASAATATVLASLGVSVANVAMPELVEYFSSSASEAQWVIVAYLLALTVGLGAAGSLGDHFGREHIFLAGVGIFATASFACAIAPTLSILILSRAIQGVSAAALMALGLALARENAPDGKLGSVMGLLGTMSAIGTALGPSLGGIMIELAGWRSIFAVMSIVAALNCLFVFWGRKPRVGITPASKASFDWLGAALFALTIGLLVFGLTFVKSGLEEVEARYFLASLAALLALIVVEGRARAPFLKYELLRDSVIASGLFINIFVSMVMMTTLVVGPYYLIHELGLNAAEMGLAVAVGPLMSAATGIVAGRLTDRFGASTIVLTGLVQMSAGALGLAILGTEFGLLGYLVALIVLTPGYQQFQAANNSILLTRGEEATRGALSALLGLSRNIGLILGASASITVFASVVGTSDFAMATDGSMARGLRVTFLVASASLALVSVTAWLIQRGCNDSAGTAQSLKNGQ